MTAKQEVPCLRKELEQVQAALAHLFEKYEKLLCAHSALQAEYDILLADWLRAPGGVQEGQENGQ